MMSRDHESQLELFELKEQPAPRAHRDTLGRLFLQLRYDQLLLSGMAVVIGVTVVFACGVERGKELVRFERAVLGRQQSASSTGPAVDPMTPAASPAAVPAVAPQALSVKKEAPALEKAPKAKGTPSKSASIKSRYAVQVVTYSRPQLAKQEMDRLRAKGEPVFLVMRDGRTIVYVGPFPSRGNASEKLTMLRPHYQDCFVRPL